MRNRQNHNNVIVMNHIHVSINLRFKTMFVKHITKVFSNKYLLHKQRHTHSTGRNNITNGFKIVQQGNTFPPPQDLGFQTSSMLMVLNLSMKSMKSLPFKSKSLLYTFS